jgi:uncharacterized protein (TIGR00106 family)
MSTLVDLAIFPMDKGASVSTYVARAAAIIADSGLAHTTGPMGTSIEGEWTAVMDVVTRCMEALQEDCDRIYATLKVDYRRGGSGRLASKVAALKHHLP